MPLPPSRGPAGLESSLDWDDEERTVRMTALQSVLQGDPEAGEALLGLMSECCDLREFGARVLRSALDLLMSAEADAACGAAYGERSEGRSNSRNGYRRRALKTCVGDLELDVPKLRRGTYYPESMLSRWSRVEASLAALVVEAYVNGVSTRDMSLLAESLGVSSLSASEVSRLTAGLDAQVDALRSRRLDDQRYCYLWVDATYVRCRVGGRSVSQAVVTAIALGEDGRKRLVGLDCVDTESYADWRAFLASVRSRGLSGLVLCVSDDHKGLVRALAEVFQGCAWQRCTVHLQRNLSAKVRSAKNERLVRELAKAVFAEGDPLVCRAAYGRACAAMRAAGEAGCADLLEAAQGDALQYLSLPREHWRRVRTNNVQERASREIKRRYRSVQSFPSRESLLRLVGAVMLEEEGDWWHHRVFSPESAALAWEAPSAPAPDGALARAIAEADRRAEALVASVVDRWGSEA